jgi:DNA-binding response OmpR family regulator
MEADRKHVILIIDVDIEMVGMLKRILQRVRADDIVAAASAAAGLEIAAQTAPDMIIVRIMMPDMDGYEVCRRLKAMPGLQSVPILLMSARRPEDVYPKAQEVGAAGYLLQPFHAQELLAAREAILAGGTYYPPLPEAE